MLPLPSLKSIRALEAAVRLGSFTAAANELGVTQSAISRQIKIVEELLETRLFRPSGRGLVPTSQAQEFAMELRAALDRIEAATRQIAEPMAGYVLRINVIHTLAMQWLIPRLTSFQKLHPKLDVRITTSSGPIGRIEEPFDILIRRANVALPGFETQPFLTDVSLPVCTPKILAEADVSEPEHLFRHTLLYPGVPGATWDNWTAKAGVTMPADARHMQFANFYVAFHAATKGLGFILSPWALVADELKSGELVAPLGDVTVACTPVYVLYPKGDQATQRSRVFVEWLIKQGAISREEYRASFLKEGRRSKRISAH